MNATEAAFHFGFHSLPNYLFTSTQDEKGRVYKKISSGTKIRRNLEILTYDH